MSVSHKSAVRGKSAVPKNLIHALEAVWLEVRTAVTLSALTLAVLGGVRRLGVGVIECALEERDEVFRSRGKELSCPKCKGRMRRAKNRRKISRMTVLGRVTYWRSSYVCCSCGHRIFPLDEQLSIKGLLHGHSDEFAKDVVLLCTIAPFGKGCELFERFYGVAVSTRLARSLTMAVGGWLFEAEMKRAEKLWELRHKEPERFEPLPVQLRGMERSKRIYVMVDNSKVGIQEGKRGRGAPRREPKLKTLRKMAQQARRKAIQKAKRRQGGPKETDEKPAEAAFVEDESWKDVRALLIFREEDLAQSSKDRREILRRRVVAHVGTKEEWQRLVHMALHDEGVYVAHEVVVIADGGSGIWEQLGELLPTTRFRKVVQVLDWFHAASHLWAVGRALKGSKTEAQRKACIRWVSPLLDAMRQGKVSNVLQRLRKLKPKTDKAKEQVRKCIKYFDDHGHRMRYSFFRKHNMLIGSGAIESVHAWVIQARLRLPGMRWSIEGANALLRLRCAWASGRFDEDFESAASSALANDRNLEAAA